MAKGRPADNRRAALAQRRRRNQTLLAGGVIVVILAIVGVFVGINASGGGGTKGITATGAVPAATLDRYTSAVSVQELRAAAGGFRLTSAGGAYPAVTADPPITTAGKPEVLFVGAEYCPYCATERWPLVLALSKFGTFHNLTTIHSAGSPEPFPNTATFSFYKSTYTSPYLTFTSVEVNGLTDTTPLQKLTPAQQALQQKYDIVQGKPSTDIPFVYFNGKAVVTGAEYDPSLLAGKSFQQIADEIDGGTTRLASSVTADAGALVASICRMTGGKPGNVCSLFPKPITS